jgi:hypothetical protein
MAMIATKNGKNAQKIEKSKFEDEKKLQEFIQDNPEVIPMYEIDEDIKVVILMREFQTRGGGRIDALGVDEYGNIYIIETKLYKNPDKKLVLAQVLDYGASIWSYYNDFSEFLSIIDEGTHKKFNMGVKDKLTEFFQLEQEEQLEELLENIKQNLNKGIFKFVVLMDELEDRLKNLILFINKSSQFDIYAVEIEYYKFESNELMIPKIFGNEVKKDIDVTSSRSSDRKKWDYESYFSELQKNVSVEIFQFSKNLYEKLSKLGDMSFGTGALSGSYSLHFQTKDGEIQTIMHQRTDGTINVLSGYFSIHSLSDKYKERILSEIKNSKLVVSKNWYRIDLYPKDIVIEDFDKLISIYEDLREDLVK